MKKDDLERLFQHMAWADSQVREALAAMGDPPERAVVLYAHVLGTELVWLDRIEHKASASPQWPALSLAECASLAERLRERYRSFLDNLVPDDLDHSVPYTNSLGRAFETRLQDILMHVALHGCYHRGQVALLLRDTNGRPLPTDYIAFVRNAPMETPGSSR